MRNPGILKRKGPDDNLYFSLHSRHKWGGGEGNLIIEKPKNDGSDLVLYNNP